MGQGARSEGQEDPLRLSLFRERARGKGQGARGKEHGARGKKTLSGSPLKGGEQRGKGTIKKRR